MSRFYAKADDEYRCRKAVLRHDVLTITGLSSDGTASIFTGRVQAVEAGHRTIPRAATASVGRLLAGTGKNVHCGDESGAPPRGFGLCTRVANSPRRHRMFKFARYGASMQDPHVIAKFYRDKADECLRRAEREDSELALRLMYRRLAECYSGFAEAEERHAAKRSLAGKGA